MNTGRRGLFRVAKIELEAALREEIARVTPLVLGTSDGLRSPEGVGGFHPAGWKARGRASVVFPRTRAASSSIQIASRRPSVPPPVHIERVLIDEGTGVPPQWRAQALARSRPR